MQDIKNLIFDIYNYREMLRSLVKRELRGRYKGSVLGFLWTFLNPLLQLCVYTFVFSRVMRMGIEDYYLFLFVALIPWMFFSTSILVSSTCILQNSSLVTKIYFPRIILPLSVVTSNFFNMLYCFVIVIGVVLLFGKNICFFTWLFLPILFFVEFVLSLGISLIVSSITVYLRDLQHILGIITMGWQFLSPVMYSADMVPEDCVNYFYLNPMTPIIIGYRDVLYYGNYPQFEDLGYAMLFSICILICGIKIFCKLERKFAEEL